MTAAASAFWQELHVELRRHAGNERFPAAWRGTLRRWSHATAARGAAAARAAIQPYPRRALARQPCASVPEAIVEHARVRCARAGLDPDARFAAIEMRNRPDIFGPAIDLLRSRGLTPVRIGEGPKDRTPFAGVVDLVTVVDRDSSLELYVLANAGLVVAGGGNVQQASHRFHRPCLALNACDPFMLYPLRAGSAYLLRTPIDLDSGRLLTCDDMCTPGYYRNLRNTGFREHAESDVTAAVAELLDAPAESHAQRRYRERVVAQGTRLAIEVAHVATWGPDDGFIGDGRIAQVQAEMLA